MKLTQESAGLVPDENAYLTREGQVVGEDDPGANELLGLAGQPIRPKLVERYGIKPTGKAKGEAREAKGAAPEAKEPEPEPEAAEARGAAQANKRKNEG